MRARRVWGVAASAAATVLVVSGGAFLSGASAQDLVAPPAIKQIDATKFPTVSVDLFGGANAITLAAGTVNIAPTSVSKVTDSGLTNGIVFVVDTSSPMALEGRLDTVKAALTQVATAHPELKYGLVTAASIPVTRTTLTDATSFINAVTALGTSGHSESSLRDSLREALAQFDGTTATMRNVVLIDASTDTVSGTPYLTLRNRVRDNGVTVLSVAIVNAALDGGLPQNIVADGHGALFAATTAATITSGLTNSGALVASERRITAQVPQGIGSFDLVTGGAHLTVAPSPGSLMVGDVATPQVVTPGHQSGPALLQTKNGKMIVIMLVAVAVTLFGAGIALLVVRGNSSLEAVLQPYSETLWGPPTEGAIEVPPVESDGSYLKTKFLKRAVRLTGSFAQRRGVLTWLEQALERADLPVHPAEALFFYTVSTAVLTALVGVVSRNVIVVLMVLALLTMLPPQILKFLGKRRRRKFQGQLPDTLQLLAGSLKAGYSMMQGVDAVSQEIKGPMGKELRRVVVESRLGRPLEDSLNDSADRMASPDFHWVVMAINIQREVGGNLAELLMTVADTMVQRERLRRDVKSLTAEGRVSAIVIGILPFALGAAMWVINPKYVKVLVTERLGQMLLAGSILLAGVGFWWMKKVIEVEV